MFPEGFEAPAAAWETEILPARVNEYDPAWLDELSLAGRVVWTRLAALNTTGERAPAPVVMVAPEVTVALSPAGTSAARSPGSGGTGKPA